MSGAGVTGQNVVPQFMTSFDIDCRMSGLGDLIVRISVQDEKVSYTIIDTIYPLTNAICLLSLSGDV